MICESEIRYLRRLQLKLQFVSDKGDELRIRGFSLGIADGIAEKSLQGIQIAPIPGYFDSVTDGPLDSAGRGLECLGDLGVQYLGDGVGVLIAHQRGVWMRFWKPTNKKFECW